MEDNHFRDQTYMTFVIFRLNQTEKGREIEREKCVCLFKVVEYP